MPTQSPALERRNRLFYNAPLLMGLLLLVDSLHFVFARLLLPYLPGGTSAMFVLAVATLETAAILGLRRSIRFAVFRENIPFFLVIGFLVATSTTFNYVAVGFVDPGTASLIAQSSIIFALGFGLIWLREWLTPLGIIGTAVALAGLFLITFQPGDYLRLGSLLVLASAFMYALHTAIVKRYGGEMDFGNFFLFRIGATTGFLLLFSSARGQLQWPGPQAWLILILAGTVDVVISRGLYYLALRRLQLSFHTIILTLSPVITILWSWLLFGELPTLLGLIGGTAVIAGVIIVTISKSRERQVARDRPELKLPG